MARKSKKKKEFNSLKDAIASLDKSIKSYSGTHFVKTGVLPIDNIFEGQGLPLGKKLEFASREGIGKSTAMLNVSANLCERGHNVIYVDAELAVTDSQLEGTGCDEYLDDTFHLVPMQSYHDVSDFLDTVIPSKPTLIVFDSITALKPKKLLDLNVEAVEPGLVSRIQSTFFMKYTDQFADNGICTVYLNQMRTKISFTHGGSEVPSGGNAMKFYMDGRFVLRKKQFLTRKGKTDKKEDLITYGADLIVEPLKNKICASRKTEMTVIYGQGVSNIMFCINMMTELGFLKQSSSYFVIDTPKLQNSIQGREATLQFVKENYEYFSSLVMDSEIETVADKKEEEVFDEAGEYPEPEESPSLEVVEESEMKAGIVIPGDEPSLADEPTGGASKERKSLFKL